MQLHCSALSEYTYYENMLLGLPKTLRQCAGVTNMYLKKLSAVADTDLLLWEDKNGVQLPETIRKFYLASNGYSFKYKYILSGDNADAIAVGSIYINALENLKQVYGYETTNDSGIKYDGKRYLIRLAPQSKVFELDLLPDRGKVVLVYLFPEDVPAIWLLTITMEFYFLSDDISTYLRMCVAHLGIPNWQLAYTPLGIPQWTENMFRMLAPHLLPLNKNLEKNFHGHIIVHEDDYFLKESINCFDKTIFDMLPIRPDPTASPHSSIVTPKVSREASKEKLKTQTSLEVKIRRDEQKHIRKKIHKKIKTARL